MSDRKKINDSGEKPVSALSVKPGVGKPNINPNNAGQNELIKTLSTDEYINGVLGSDRIILAQAITLVESSTKQAQTQAQETLASLISHSGKSIRIGITGMPGAGKSTFIESFGCYLADNNHKVAVLAVDPSSSLSRGSILGDKTRMEKLSRHPNAFIRPTPGGGTLGGVARKTRESIILFEAAGYDIILIETIGVGQNEITVRSMVDFFLLMLITGAGDDLQGIKRGVMELTDAIVINKADGDNLKPAQHARKDVEQALRYFQPITSGWQSKVFTASALYNEGIDEIWRAVEEFSTITKDNGTFVARRQQQLKDWLHSMLAEQITAAFYRNPKIEAMLPEIEKKVLSGSLPASAAASNLIKVFEDKTKP